MMRSLYSGVSGLRTHQTRMDVIGNNIANVNTTAYKAKTMNFSDMLYQTTQAGTAANPSNNTGGTNPRQIGLGVKGAAINTSITQEGANQSTGNPFDLKISGEAFFVVSDGTSTYYTRDGSFDVDDDGNLVMSSTGFIVQGWGVDKEGKIVQTVGPLNVMGDNEAAPAATTSARITGIVDAEDSKLETDEGYQLSVELYDKAGYLYNLQFGVLPTMAESTTTISTNNTETEYALPSELFKVDMSELTYTYTDASDNNTKKTLKSTEMPETLLAKLEKAARDAVYGGKAAAGVKVNGSPALGDKGDLVTIDLKAFIAADPDLQQDILENGKLNEITELVVNFSGGVGFVKTKPDSYPVKDALVVSEEAVEKLGYTAGGTGSVMSYTRADTSSITAIVQTYTDVNGDTVTKYVFKDGAGNKIEPGEFTNDISKILELFKTGEGKKNTYVTNSPQTGTTAVPKEYKLTLLRMLDNEKNEVNIDALKNNGTTSWNLIFNKEDGQFRYVGSEGNDTFTVNLSAIDQKFENLTIDASKTQNVGNEKKSTLSGKKIDGYKVGKLTGVSVGTDGLITALYSNGVQKTLGQVCVGKFPNAMGLENAGDNLYQVTASSGDVQICDIKAEGIGAITTGVLEMSNVDLSQQFTNMITTQRGFQANSRIITTSDSLLEELVNLKR